MNPIKKFFGLLYLCFICTPLAQGIETAWRYCNRRKIAQAMKEPLP